MEYIPHDYYLHLSSVLDINRDNLLRHDGPSLEFLLCEEQGAALVVDSFSSSTTSAFSGAKGGD
jgi:hypothetical protein